MRMGSETEGEKKEERWRGKKERWKKEGIAEDKENINTKRNCEWKNVLQNKTSLVSLWLI